MGLVVAAYVILSLVAGGMTMFATGFWPGAAILGGAFLSLTVVGGFKAALFRHDTENPTAAMALSLVIVGLLVWLSQKFQVALFGLHITGPEWCVAGAAVSILYSSTRD
ncbi:MAG: hypothetical protein ACREHE_12210 [Rhizomicrobium sp.]